MFKTILNNLQSIGIIGAFAASILASVSFFVTAQEFEQYQRSAYESMQEFRLEVSNNRVQELSDELKYSPELTSELKALKERELEYWIMQKSRVLNSLEK